jgi:hypothetical protein
MVSSGILRHVALVRTDVSEKLSASFIRVTIIGELGTTLAVTSNWRMLRRNTKYLPFVSSNGVHLIYDIQDDMVTDRRSCTVLNGHNTGCQEKMPLWYYYKYFLLSYMKYIIVGNSLNLLYFSFSCESDSSQHQALRSWKAWLHWENPNGHTEWWSYRRVKYHIFI